MALQRLLASALLLAVSVLGAWALSASGAWAFGLTSPDTADGGKIADKHVYNGLGCRGGNLSPALRWSDPPAGTKSFAVTILDPDAPKPGGFWHWAVYNVPSSAPGLPEGVGEDGKGLPKGARQARNDFGGPGYGGPCPPKGDQPHRYQFTVHALKVDKLDLPLHADASIAGSLIDANSLGKASLTALYGR